MSRIKKWKACTLGLLLLTVPLPVYADDTAATTETATQEVVQEVVQEEIKEEKAEIPDPLQIFCGYEFSDGSFDAWSVVGGVAINENTVITGDMGLQDANVLKQYMKSEYRNYKGYEALGVDFETVSPVYRIYDGSDHLIRAELVNSNGFCIFETEEAVKPVTIANQEAAEDDIVYVTGIRSRAMDAFHYIDATDIVKEEVSGSKAMDFPVAEFARDGSLLSLISRNDSALTRFNEARIPVDMKEDVIRLAEIKSVLDQTGRKYITGEQLAQNDYTKLEETLKKANAKLSGEIEYTEETKKALLERIAEAEAIINKEVKVDQTAIDATEKAVTDAISALVAVKKINYTNLIIYGSIGAFFAIILGYLLHRYWKDPDYWNDIKEKGLFRATFRMKAKAKKGGTPAVKPQNQPKNQANMQKKAKTAAKPTKQAKAQAKAQPKVQEKQQKQQTDPAVNYQQPNEDWTAVQQAQQQQMQQQYQQEHPQQYQQQDQYPQPYQPQEYQYPVAVGRQQMQFTNGRSGDTTVLTENQTSSVLPKAYLIRKKTNEAVELYRLPFLVGKSSDAQFSVPDNDAISSLHCAIVAMNGEYDIFDNTSLNGTFVYGYKLMPRRAYPLKDGVEIIVANETFIFRIERS